MYPAGKFSKFLNLHKNLLTLSIYANLLWNVLKLNESTFSLFLGLTRILPIFFYEFSYDNLKLNKKWQNFGLYRSYVHAICGTHSSCLFHCWFK
jgi:hypothetical protein